ncbi:MAG: phosphoribosylamine--glycine ligase [Treponema sp.]
MKVLVIGNGGREDAICKKIAESNKLTKLYCAKGNAGTLRYAENKDLTGNQEILHFALQEKIDLVIVGPENPLCEGIVDMFQEHHIPIFGPNKRSAQLEGSKQFAKRFMQKYGIPTAEYAAVRSKEESQAVLKTAAYPVVIKADGLCAGKGVRICTTQEEAARYISELFDDNIFGNQGSTAVIEEFLSGREASLLCFVSNTTVIPMESARDYKKIFENDQGENTGGVGCYSPSELFDEKLQSKIDELIKKISVGLEAEHLGYCGILFIGLMIRGGEPKVLEFNTRFGDPETEVVLPRLESDLLEVVGKALNGTLTAKDLVWKKEKCLTVVLTAEGYPHAYEKGKPITGLDAEPASGLYVYHNNTRAENGKILSDGGRVLSVTATGTDFEEIRQKVYAHIETLHFDGMHYRKDIGIID